MRFLIFNEVLAQDVIEILMLEQLNLIEILYKKNKKNVRGGVWGGDN